LPITIRESLFMEITSSTSTQSQPYSSVATQDKLSEDQKKQVDYLKKRDAEVHAHEQAHMAAGAGIVKGGPHYDYEKGPDGRTYAVGGEVSIDTSEERTPQATIAKMERVRAAALAPANPSGQDQSVAAQAGTKIAEARVKMAKSQGKGSNVDVSA
jgi:hypothetical protein